MLMVVAEQQNSNNTNTGKTILSKEKAIRTQKRREQGQRQSPGEVRERTRSLQGVSLCGCAK
jgi:hypothetical protein